MNKQISIVMADDHTIVRKGLRISVEESGEFKVLGEAGDGRAALEMIRVHRPHVAVLDVDMPNMDGFEVAREITQQGLSSKVIFLTLHTDEDVFQTAIEVGVKRLRS